MSSFEIALLGIGMLLVLLVIRVPVAVAMITVGVGGYVSLSGWGALLNYAKTSVYYAFSNYDLSVVPMFLLMSQFASKAGLSRALFQAANTFLGHWRGGVAMAAVGGCAGFGAICGSSLATAATMGQVALPELKRYNYSGALATGALAAGGTLGILIPPSVVLVIFAIAVEANIVTMFQAALVPGIMAALGYLIAISIYVRLKPEAGPVGRRAGKGERIAALVETWPVILIFAVVIGGIYMGVFTPTEGAAFGAFGTAVIAFWRGGLRLDGFLDCVKGAAVSSGMIFMILMGADFFNAFLGFSRMPLELADWIGASGLAPIAILMLMLLIYLLLGCVMDSLAMILLTVPIFWPVIAGLDFGMPEGDLKMWFGIIVLIVVEVGLITPPVGLNVFVINSMAPGVRLKETFIGVLPFLASDAVRVLLLILFPAFTLWLPHLLK
ncbi:MAG: TRAP transporter large permease [Alphaproteobacteria bacterium]|nr:TRAP transporter large permease [Alphaproteobacteria bacterium]